MDELKSFLSSLINELNTTDVFDQLPHSSVTYINEKLNEFGIGIELGDDHIE